MFATFVLMLATFMVAFAFVAFFVLAVAFVFATLMIAFAFVAFFVLALVLWHVGFHFLNFLCHADDFSLLLFCEFVPVGDASNDFVHCAHHLRAWSLFVMVAFMLMLVALLFLVFAVVLTILFVFLFVAA